MDRKPPVGSQVSSFGTGEPLYVLEGVWNKAGVHITQYEREYGLAVLCSDGMFREVSTLELIGPLACPHCGRQLK